MTEKKAPAAFPRETIMSTEQLAAALDVAPSTVEKSDFPACSLGEGNRKWRFHWGAVCDEIARRSRRLARAG